MKKNILFIVYTFSYGGGAEKLLASIANNLDSEKYNIDIIEFRNMGETEETHHSINKNSIIKTNNKLINSIIHNIARNFPRLIRGCYIHKKYDLEIAFNYEIPTYIVSKSKSKKILWIHGPIDDLDYKKETKFTQKIKLYIANNKHKKSFENCDKVITISNLTKQSILKLYPNLKKNIVILHNALNLQKIDILSNEYEVLNEDNKFKIISVGRLDSNKNQILLIEAAKLLAKEYSNFEISFVGKGEMEDYLKNKVKEYGLEDKIKFRGYIENPFPLIKNSDVLCLTSILEGFGNVILEAMRLKTAVISTECGLASEIFKMYSCGLISEYNAEDLKQKLLYLINNKEEKQTLEDNAFKVSTKFSLETYVKEIESLIDSMC